MYKTRWNFLKECVFFGWARKHEISFVIVSLVNKKEKEKKKESLDF